MPYIKQERRDEMAIESSDSQCPKNCGELNYEFTHAINLYCLQKGLSYQTINDILGALEGAKMEFYRRIAAPYESVKDFENGDVYTVTI